MLYFPDAWKLAKVYSLYKGKNDRTCAALCRSNSLVNVGCKILQRLFVNNLNSYLNSNSMLESCQHGFQSSLSSAVCSIIKCIADYLNQHISCDLIMIYVSRTIENI